MKTNIYAYDQFLQLISYDIGMKIRWRNGLFEIFMNSLVYFSISSKSKDNFIVLISM